MAQGRSVWAHLRAVREHGDGEHEPCTVAMVENITERKRAERDLIRQAELNEHQALHDPLTGLPNRILFGERIDQAIRHARRNGTLLAVALMDLDRFKEVNDSLGHPAGDQLLIEVSRRMRDAVRASDTVARLGGDEFGLLLPELQCEEDVEPVIERIRALLERPVEVQGLPLAIEASIGVAIFPQHGESAQVLIQRADVAMYDSKRDNTPFTSYDEDSHEYDVNRLTLVAELRRAIAERELVLHYQPKAALANGDVASVEALIRWEHPERGLLYPDAFIPLAQETSLIGPLTLYVIDEALRQGREWREQGLKLAVSVNLSTRSLLDIEFPSELKALLAQWRADSGLARARGHRVVDARQPDARQGDPHRALAARHPAVDRRLRDRLLVAVLSAPASRRRDQDRPVVRDEHERAGRRRGDRPLDGRPRPQPRAGRRGRRSRVARAVEPVA